MTAALTTPTTVTTTAPTTAPALNGDRAKLRGAAQQFEAILVRQMLAAARKTSFGGEQLFSGQGMDTFRQMQDERFADIASQRGAFGLARTIEAQLARTLDAPQPAPTSTATEG